MLCVSSCLKIMKNKQHREESFVMLWANFFLTEKILFLVTLDNVGHIDR